MDTKIKNKTAQTLQGTYMLVKKKDMSQNKEVDQRWESGSAKYGSVCRIQKEHWCWDKRPFCGG